MGYQSGEHGAAHEGSSAAWTLMEGEPVRLEWRTAQDQDAPLVSAACACGWHSTPWAPSVPAEARWYRIGGLELAEADENRVYREWRAHLETLPKRKQPPQVTRGGPAGAPLRFDEEDKRDYLGERGIHCGDMLEVQLRDGSWMVARYEVETRGTRQPVLYVGLAGGEESAALRIPAGALFRWPEGSR